MVGFQHTLSWSREMCVARMVGAAAPWDGASARVRVTAAWFTAARRGIYRSLRVFPHVLGTRLLPACLMITLAGRIPGLMEDQRETSDPADIASRGNSFSSVLGNRGFAPFADKPSSHHRTHVASNEYKRHAPEGDYL